MGGGCFSGEPPVTALVPLHVHQLPDMTGAGGLIVLRAPGRSTLPTMVGTATGETANGHELLEAARRGDENAFGGLIEPYRGEHHAVHGGPRA